MAKRMSAFVLLVSVCGGTAIFAQSAATLGPVPKFSVISVKAGDPNVLRRSLEYRPELGFAYDVRAHQIVGGPKWRDSATLAIEALAESPIPIPAGPRGTEMFRTMVQGLLSERFQLIARQETLEESVYELVVPKGRLQDEGRNGGFGRNPNGTGTLGGLRRA